MNSLLRVRSISQRSRAKQRTDGQWFIIHPDRAMRTGLHEDRAITRRCFGCCAQAFEWLPVGSGFHFTRILTVYEGPKTKGEHEMSVGPGGVDNVKDYPVTIVGEITVDGERCCFSVLIFMEQRTIGAGYFFTYCRNLHGNCC